MASSERSSRILGFLSVTLKVVSKCLNGPPWLVEHQSNPRFQVLDYFLGATFLWSPKNTPPTSRFPVRLWRRDGVAGVGWSYEWLHFWTRACRLRVRLWSESMTGWHKNYRSLRFLDASDSCLASWEKDDHGIKIISLIIRKNEDKIRFSDGGKWWWVDGAKWQGRSYEEDYLYSSVFSGYLAMKCIPKL